MTLHGCFNFLVSFGIPNLLHRLQGAWDLSAFVTKWNSIYKSSLPCLVGSQEVIICGQLYIGEIFRVGTLREVQGWTNYDCLNIGSFGHVKLIAYPFSLKCNVLTHYQQIAICKAPAFFKSVILLFDIFQMSPSEEVLHFR